MGIIAALRDTAIPVIVYLVMIGVVVAGVFWRAELPVILLAVFAPLPTLWYATHGFPLATDAIDLLVMSAAIGVIVNKGGYQKTPLSIIVFATILYTYISLWISAIGFNLPMPISLDNPFLKAWKNYALIFLIYYVGFNSIRTENQVKLLINSCIAVLAFMVFQEVRGFSAGDSYSHGRRSDGPFWIVGLNANHFASFLCYVGLFAFGQFLFAGKSKRAWIYLFIYLSSLYPLMFSYSRGAYVASLAGLIFFAFMRNRRLAFLLILFALFWKDILPATVIERIEMTEGSGGGLDDSSAFRLEVWELAIALFRDNLFAGIGFNGFIVASQGMKLHDTHNFYLKIAAEQGLLGLFLWFAFIVGVGIKAWSLFRHSFLLYSKGCGFATLGCLVGVLVCNLFGDRFSQIEISVVLVLLFAAMQRQGLIDSRSIELGDAVVPQRNTPN